MSRSNINEIEIKNSIDVNKIVKYNNTSDNVNLNQNIETEQNNNVEEDIYNITNNNQMQNTKIENTNVNSDCNIEENIHDITSNKQVNQSVVTELKCINDINPEYNIAQNIANDDDNNSNQLVESNYTSGSNTNVHNDINETNLNDILANTHVSKFSNDSTEVVIYIVSDNYQSIVCQVVEKAYKLNKKCLLLCNNAEEISFFDSKLWTYSKLSFIPHGSKCSININDAIYCNTWISDALIYVNNPDYVIILGDLLRNDITCNFNHRMCTNSFEKIIFISYNETDKLNSIRNKYKRCTIWKQSNNKWIQSN